MNADRRDGKRQDEAVGGHTNPGRIGEKRTNSGESTVAPTGCGNRTQQRESI